MEKRSLKNSLLRQKKSIVSMLIVSLLAVSIFQLLPILFPSTSNFVFIVVFAFTVCFLFLTFVNLNNFKTAIQSNFFYISLLIWTIIISIKGIIFNDYTFREMIISPYILLPFLIPFTVKYFSVYVFKRIISLIFYVNIVYIVFIVLFLIQSGNDITKSLGFVEDVNKYLAFPNFLVFFSFPILSKKEKVISAVVFILGFLMSIYCARRSLTWTFGCAFIIFWGLKFLNTKNNKLKRIQLFIIIPIVGLILYFGYEKYEQILFGNLLEKINSDSRGGVLKDFYKDMDFGNMIFGKGINGKYTLTKDYSFENELPNQRNIIEAGYLNIILSGGYIYLVLLILIYIKAIYNGFFKTNNNYSKYLAAFILLHILEAYPAGVLTFNIRFFLIWFCIALCFSKNFLNAQDKKLDLLYQKM